MDKVRLDERKYVEYQHGSAYPWLVLWRDGSLLDRYAKLHDLFRGEFHDEADSVPDDTITALLALSAPFRVEVGR